jgi:hypothetical protein
MLPPTAFPPGLRLLVVPPPDARPLGRAPGPSPPEGVPPSRKGRGALAALRDALGAQHREVELGNRDTGGEDGAALGARDRT